MLVIHTIENTQLEEDSGEMENKRDTKKAVISTDLHYLTAISRIKVSKIKVKFLSLRQSPLKSKYSIKNQARNAEKIHTNSKLQQQKK